MRFSNPTNEPEMSLKKYQKSKQKPEKTARHFRKNFIRTKSHPQELSQELHQLFSSFSKLFGLIWN